MDPQPAAAVGFLGPVERPGRPLVVRDHFRAVSAGLDHQARAVAERLAGHLPTARR